MPEHDFKALYDQYTAVIAQMPPTFTSHLFILRLAQQNQRAYIEALYAYRDVPRSGKTAPFMIVHGILAQHLFEYPDLIEKLSPAVKSKDIFGSDNTASEWRKKR
jgi:hypothetical protein